MKEWLTSVCSAEVDIDDLVAKLEKEGCRSIEDLRLFREEDLKDLGLNLVARRTILRELLINQIKPDADVNELRACLTSLGLQPEGLRQSMLAKLGLSTFLVNGKEKIDAPPNSRNPSVWNAENIEQIREAAHTILKCLGENPSRHGLLNTPKRVADSLLFLTEGYDKDLETVVNGAIFPEDHEEMVLVRDIDFFSLCEHHLLPFHGKIHIAYVPDQCVIGLSKLARIAQMYARRLQVQERLTRQIAEALTEVLRPQGVAIVIEASHCCMAMRGVEKAGAVTTTSCLRGLFLNDSRKLQEFMALIQKDVRAHT